MSGPADIEYGPDAWHTPTLPEAYAELEQYADAMREALRRLGDLADKASGTTNSTASVGVLVSQLRREAVAARDLYAPKESGQ